MSNFMTHLARGNTELSVALTTTTTAAALVTTPLNLAFWAGLHPDAAPLLRSVALDPGDMLRTIGTVIAAPLALGMLIAGFKLPRVAAVLRRPLRILSLVVFAVDAGRRAARQLHGRVGARRRHLCDRRRAQRAGLRDRVRGLRPPPGSRRATGGPSRSRSASRTPASPS
jgi:hypothetical protein